MKNKIYQHRIVCGFGALMFLFYLLFTKLILKSDDGHFLGIINEAGFNIFDWLRLRYETISGRTFCELLTALFLSENIIYWKIFSSALWVVFALILIKITSAFGIVGDDTGLFCSFFA